MGVIFQDVESQGNYFVEQITPVNTDIAALKSFSVEPIEVLEALSVDSASRYSGSAAGMLRSVIVGVGALGASMFSCWIAQGWGEWTLVDNDHLKPHNFVRYPASAAYIGWNKADAMADLQHRQYPGLRKACVIKENACDGSSAALQQAYEESELIVDVTTTLDFPRSLSQNTKRGRIVSAFVTPSGADSVLLVEDKASLYKIDTLEAQYYRGIIRMQFGATHLQNLGNSVRSGASCRDVSFALPYTAILSHAAILAEQIQQVVPQDGPQVKIWCRDKNSGEIKVVELPTFLPLYQDLGSFTVVWDVGLLEAVRNYRTKAFPNETGGVLLGYFDLNVKKIYVVDILSAPDDSVGTPTGFTRGIDGVPEHLMRVHDRTRGNVQYLGEWHSHPSGVEVKPSPTDLHQANFTSTLMKQDGLPSVMLIVGETEANYSLFNADSLLEGKA